MPTIGRMERLLQMCKTRSVVLCMLFGLCSFFALAGAGMDDTSCDLGVVTMEAMATASGAKDEVVVAMLAGDVLAMAVTSDVGGAMLPPMSSIDTTAPLPSILVAGAGQPNPPGPPNPPNPQGLPPARTRRLRGVHARTRLAHQIARMVRRARRQGPLLSDTGPIGQ